MRIMLIEKPPEATMSGAFIQRDLREVDAVVILRPGADMRGLALHLIDHADGYRYPGEVEEANDAE